jgi:hypothetical protein
MDDLGPEERALHELLRATRPEPLPIGFRDAVMRAVRGERRTTAWEWSVAAALALPGLAYLARQIVANGAELGASLASISSAAQGLDQARGAVVVVDGLAVMSFALVGLASAVAANAMLRGNDPPVPMAR